MSVRPHAGHSAGRLQILLLHLEHRYPPREGLEWQAHKDGADSTVRDGNPIINRELAACFWECWTGGVVTSIINSRKCCSLSATPYTVSSPLLVFAQSTRHIATCAASPTTATRILSFISVFIVWWMSPGSEERRAPKTISTSRVPCLGVWL